MRVFACMLLFSWWNYVVLTSKVLQVLLDSNFFQDLDCFFFFQSVALADIFDNIFLAPACEMQNFHAYDKTLECEAQIFGAYVV